MALEYVGLAPKGSQRVQAFLEKAAEGLVDGGKWEFFLLISLVILIISFTSLTIVLITNIFCDRILFLSIAHLKITFWSNSKNWAGRLLKLRSVCYLNHVFKQGRLLRYPTCVIILLGVSGKISSRQCTSSWLGNLIWSNVEARNRKLLC